MFKQNNNLQLTAYVPLSAIVFALSLALASGCWKPDPEHCADDATCVVTSRPGFDAEKPFCHPTGHFCWAGCQTDDDCSDEWQCSDAGRCEEDGSEPIPPNPSFAILGATCANDNECESRHCTDGVCCDVDNCGVCQRCNADTATPGQCAAIPDGLDLNNGCGSETDICGKSCVNGSCGNAASTAARCDTSCSHTTGQDDNSVPLETRNQDTIAFFTCDGNGNCVNNVSSDASPTEEPCEGFLKCMDDGVLPICRALDAGCTTHADCVLGSLCDMSEETPSCVDPAKVVAVNEGDNLQEKLNELFVTGTEAPTKTHIALFGDPAPLYSANPPDNRPGYAIASRRDSHPSRVKVTLIGMKPDMAITIKAVDDDVTAPAIVALPNVPHLSLEGLVDYHIENLTISGAINLTDLTLDPDTGTPENELRSGLQIRKQSRTLAGQTTNTDEFPTFTGHHFRIVSSPGDGLHVEEEVIATAKDFMVEDSGLSGIKLGEKSFTTLENFTVKDAGGKDPDQIAAGVNFSESAVGVLDNAEVDSTKQGFGLKAFSFANITVKNSRISNNRLGGILTGKSSGFTVTDSIIENNAPLAASWIICRADNHSKQSIGWTSCPTIFLEYNGG